MPTVGGASVRISPDLDTFRADLVSKMQVALAGVSGSIPIGADLSAFNVALGDVAGKLSALGAQTASPSVTANTAAANAEIDDTTMRLLELGATTASPNVGVDGADTAVAKLAGVGAAADALGAEHPTITPVVDSAPAVAGIAAISAAETTAAAASKSGGGGGIISALLWGGGSGRAFGIGAGMAGVGSLGSLAGLGPEHLVSLLAGIVGSAGGAAVGGGLLAAGSLGTTAVGMGTDLAGIGQATGDIKQTYQAMDALNTAIQQYGASSAQAGQAQLALNTVLGSFSPVARQAVVQAAEMASTLHDYFDQVTGQAEKTGAQILTQLGQVAEPFIGLIGRYATENTKIIQGALQPLFTWLDSKAGGLGIFNQLEAKFQGQLPTAMNAFTNGIELVARTIDLASQATGGFLNHLNAFLENANGAGWGTFEGHIEKLIADFHEWDAFIVALVKDIAALFSKDSNTVGSLLTYLTQALDNLHTWIESTTGSAELHTIFEVHKEQLMALLPILGTLITTYGKLFFAVSPDLVTAFTGLATAIGYVLTEITKLGPIGDYAIAISALAGKLGLAGTAFSAFRGVVRAISPGIASTAAGMVGLGTSASVMGANVSAAAAKAGVSVKEMAVAIDTAEPQVAAAMDGVESQLRLAGSSAEQARLQVQVAMKNIVADIDAVGEAATAVQIQVAAAMDKISADMVATGVSADVAEGAVDAAMEGMAATTVATATAMDIAIGSTGVGLVVIGLGVAITVLATHWQEALHDILAWTSNAINFLVKEINGLALAFVGVAATAFIMGDPIIGVLGLILAAVVELATHWKSAWNDMKVFALAISQDVENAFDTLINGLSKAWGDFEAVAGVFAKAISQNVENAFDTMINGISKAWGDLGNGVSASFTGIANDVGDIANAMVNAVTGAFSGMVNGVINSLNVMIKAVDDIKFKGVKFLGVPLSRASGAWVCRKSPASTSPRACPPMLPGPRPAGASLVVLELG